MRRSVALYAGLFVLIASVRSFAADTKPPAGWREYIPVDKSFAVWLPEKGTGLTELERGITIRGHTLKLTTLHIDMGTTTYDVQKLFLPAGLARGKKQEVEAVLREMLITDLNGKVTEEKDAKLGRLSGRELALTLPKGAARARLFVTGGGRAYIGLVVGPKTSVEGESTMIFLNSMRHAGQSKPTANPNPTTPKTKSK